MLRFIRENKRLLSIHEHNFVELIAFHANTNVFQSNTNASLKNLETRVGQLALSMQNHFRDSFPSSTKKNPKGYMTFILKSGKEFQQRKEYEKRMNEKGKQAETKEETKLDSSEMTEERRELKVQKKQLV